MGLNRLAITAIFLCLGACASLGAGLLRAQDADTATSMGNPASNAAGGRPGYIVNVELPLVGERDERVRQQLRKIAEAARGSQQRPVVVLRFAAEPLSAGTGEDRGDQSTRGSQFERCLALARYLTAPEAARIRLVAYLPDNVEGHAVLPVLACEEIVAASSAELGRAAADAPTDATVSTAYRDINQRRATLPEALVMAMLDPAEEVYELELTDGATRSAGRAETKSLREQGRVLQEKTVWPGGSLASFNGKQMRANRWIATLVNDESSLAAAVGVNGSLRTARQLPQAWNAVSVSISNALIQSRVNQISRALDERIAEDQVNLVVFQLQPAVCDFQQASRLADYIAALPEEVYTLGLIREPLSGPLGLVAVACQEAVLIGEATLGPDSQNSISVKGDKAAQIFLGNLATQTGRPLALMSVLVDSEVKVQEYIHQQTGKRAIFANWQVQAQVDANQWLARREVAGGDPIKPEIALQYRLVDSTADSASIALGKLGLSEVPVELNTPWLDASIEMLLAQSWLPRLLLTIGFFALMAELGNPGIGAGAFLAGLCFLGFFWIEGLNGNVEWLEVLLFIAGLVALAMEIFVVPGFGVFGIGGLLMLFVSVVLASQTFVWPTNSAQLSEVAANLFWTACLALGGMIGLLFMHRHLERLPMLKWVTLLPEEDNEDLHYRESVAHRDHLIGQEGITTTRLNPSGKAQFGPDIVAVVGSGRLIAEGTPVKVVEVRGNLVIVEEYRPAMSNGQSGLEL